MYNTESTEEIAGLSITANAMEGSDTIEITGETSKTNEDVTFYCNITKWKSS